MDSMIGLGAAFILGGIISMTATGHWAYDRMCESVAGDGYEVVDTHCYRRDKDGRLVDMTVKKD